MKRNGFCSKSECCDEMLGMGFAILGDAGQNNVENMDASAYAQAQQISDAAAGQLAGMQETLNGTAGQLNQAAEGLKGASLGAKSGEMKAGAAQMELG